MTDLLAADGFRAGVACGAVATGLVLARAPRARRPPWYGLAFVAAATVALLVQGDLGLGPDAPAWSALLIPIVGLAGGLVLALFAQGDEELGLLPGLLAVSLLGLWATTPETRHVALLAGVGLPLVLLGWPRARVTTGLVGSVLVVTVVTWAAVVDGWTRPGSVVGGVACLGILWVEPLLRRRPRPLALVAAHVWLVVACSRVAGMRDGGGAALGVAVAAYLVTGVLLYLSASPVSGSKK